MEHSRQLPRSNHPTRYRLESHETRTVQSIPTIVNDKSDLIDKGEIEMGIFDYFAREVTAENPHTTSSGGSALE